MRKVLQLLSIMIGLSSFLPGARADLTRPEPVPVPSSQDDVSEEPLQCELLLRGRWPVEKAAQTIHRLLVDRDFTIYFAQGTERLFANLGIGTSTQAKLQNLRMRVEENLSQSPRKVGDGDYRVKFRLEGQKKSVAGLSFDAPPVFAWLAHAGSPRDFEKTLTKLGHDFEVMQPDSINNTVLAVNLKSLGEVKLYLAVYNAENSTETHIEIGAYLPCRSPNLRDSVGVSRLRNADGWQCRAPLLRFN